MIKLLFILIYVTLSLFGLYKLKSSTFGFNIAYISGFMSYGGGFILWLYILRLYPLSIAFPLAAGSLIIGTNLVGVFILREQSDLTRLIGSLLVLAGIIMLAISDLAGPHE